MLFLQEQIKGIIISVTTDDCFMGPIYTHTQGRTQWTNHSSVHRSAAPETPRFKTAHLHPDSTVRSAVQSTIPTLAKFNQNSPAPTAPPASTTPTLAVARPTLASTAPRASTTPTLAAAHPTLASTAPQARTRRPWGRRTPLPAPSAPWSRIAVSKDATSGLIYRNFAMPHRIYTALNLPSSGFLIQQVTQFNNPRQYTVCQVHQLVGTVRCC